MMKYNPTERDYQSTTMFILQNFGVLIVLKMLRDKPRYQADMRLELAEMFGDKAKIVYNNAINNAAKWLSVRKYINYYRVPLGNSPNPKRFKSMFEITQRGTEYLELKERELDCLYWMIKDYGFLDEDLRIMEEIRMERLDWKPENETGVWNELNETSE